MRHKATIEIKHWCTLKNVGWRKIVVSVSLCSTTIYLMRSLEREKSPTGNLKYISRIVYPDSAQGVKNI